MRERKRIYGRCCGKILRYILVTMFAMIMIYPLIWLFFASFKVSYEVYDSTHLFPQNGWHFENFINGWKSVEPYSYFKFYINTFILVGGVVLGNLFSASLVGYGFARGRFKGRRVLFAILLGTMMLPNTVTMIPNYIIFTTLGWNNTYLPFIVPAFLGGTAFFIFLMVQFIRGIPGELDEAAKMDGCNSFQIYMRVIMPICVPTLITVAIFSFLWTWDNFMGQLIYISEMSKFTVPLALKLMIDPLSGIDWGAVLAMCLISIIPSLIVYFVAQDHFSEGITTTGLKG